MNLRVSAAGKGGKFSGGVWLSLIPWRHEVAELRALVRALAGQVDGLTRENAALRSENQQLKDEIARLKRLPSRLPFAPSGMEKASAAPAPTPAQPRRRGAKSDRGTRGVVVKADDAGGLPLQRLHHVAGARTDVLGGGGRHPARTLADSAGQDDRRADAGRDCRRVRA